MNYKRLTEIDQEIDTLKEQIFQLEGGPHRDIISGEITLKYHPSSFRTISGWQQETFGFKIVRENILVQLKNKIRELKVEKNKILNNKWWQFFA